MCAWQLIIDVAELKKEAENTTKDNKAGKEAAAAAGAEAGAAMQEEAMRESYGADGKRKRRASKATPAKKVKKPILLSDYADEHELNDRARLAASAGAASDSYVSLRVNP